MAYLQHQANCEHATCPGHQVVRKGFFGGMVCDCPCHRLTGNARDKFISENPGSLARLLREMQLKPWR